MTNGIATTGQAPLTPAAVAEIAGLAARAAAARGVLMTVIGFAGAQAENALEVLPDGVKDAVEAATARALDLACRGAEAAGRVERAPDMGRHGHALAAAVSGAAGGFGGLGTSLVEVPVTVAIIFAAIQKAARAEGFDPGDAAVRRQCLMVFAAGDPADAAEDGVNTSFLMSRAMIGGASLHRLIAAVAPGLAAMLTRKLAAQAMPVLGGVAGAGINFAFTRYYRDLAGVRFALLRLARAHGEAVVRTAFQEARMRGRIGPG